MKFVKAKPNEYLVIGRHGRLVNRGLSGSALLLPGSSCVTVPSMKQEAAFAMTQETKDGIPLRFKGVVIYRVCDPAQAAQLFDFSKGAGHAEISALISHVCLGELREAVSHMTMSECIEQRKTTLTTSIALALQGVIAGKNMTSGVPDVGWGIELDVVQVAQVFIVDDDLRKELEAETRNRIRSESELSNIRTREGIGRAQVMADRALKKDELETVRQFKEIQQEKIEIEQDLLRRRIETETPVKLLEVARQMEVLKQELEMRQIQNQVQRFEVEGDMLEERARHDLRKDILPLEQVTPVAEALSKMLQGANLSVYGAGADFLAKLGPVMDLLVSRIRDGWREGTRSHNSADTNR